MLEAGGEKFVFSRTYEGETTVVGFNRSQSATGVEIDLVAQGISVSTFEAPISDAGNLALNQQTLAYGIPAKDFAMHVLRA